MEASGTLWDAFERSWELQRRSGTLPEASKAFQDALEQFQADNKVVRTLQEALDRRNYRQERVSAFDSQPAFCFHLTARMATYYSMRASQFTRFVFLHSFLKVYVDVAVVTEKAVAYLSCLFRGVAKCLE